MRSWLGKLLLLIAGTGVGILAGEGLLRVFRPQIFPVHPPGMYTLDPEVGYVPTPGFRGELRRAEFRVRFRIAETGLRGTDPRPGGRRVLVLGDSMAWGFGVADHETVAARLEELLSARPGGDVQVLNGAVPGYGTADELAWLRTRGAALGPDLVVLFFLPLNDFEDNRAPAATWAALRDGMLAARREVDASLDWPWWLRAKTWLKYHSHLAHLLSDRAGYLMLRLGMASRLGALWQDGEDFTAGDARTARELLVEVAATAEALGARTLLVLTPGQDQVVSDEPGRRRSPMVVAEAAATAGVPWIDLVPPLRQRADRLELYYPQDGHWTARGNRAVAEVVAAKIVDDGLMP